MTRTTTKMNLFQYRELSPEARADLVKIFLDRKNQLEEENSIPLTRRKLENELNISPTVITILYYETNNVRTRGRTIQGVLHRTTFKNLTGEQQFDITVKIRETIKGLIKKGHNVRLAEQITSRELNISLNLVADLSMSLFQMRQDSK